ncbi:MAG: DNA methyltransferase [Phycisphaerae bacterium]|nr:DNA methyltransferase [Phycisphaerae bacterium]
MIKYLGSKRLLLPSILGAVAGEPGARTVLDLFSGTSRVGHALKARGYRVIANDHNAYAAALARCYVAADREDRLADATRLVGELNARPGRAGYFTETFCVRSRYLHPSNGERVDAIREAIARLGLDPELESVLLVSLMEAADRVDSTTGVQMAYLKDWAPRALKPLELRVPALLPRARHGKGEAHALDALDAAGALEADVVYVDPPYNQHSYLGNYHVWESLARWDKPEVYGVACKRIDCRGRRSRFNSRSACAGALTQVLGALRARTIIVSFSNEGFIGADAMAGLLGGLWGGARVSVVEHDYPRYVGARIGIYSPGGVKVGRVGHLSNKEYLFVVSRGPEGDDGARREQPIGSASAAIA